GARVDVIGERRLKRQLVVESVLDGVERDQLHAWRVTQHVDRADAAAVHAGRMREEADALALEHVEAARLEHGDAEHHWKSRRGWNGRGCDHRCGGNGRSAGRRLAGAAAEQAEQNDEWGAEMFQRGHGKRVRCYVLGSETSPPSKTFLML